jgi:hypothetical protein
MKGHCGELTYLLGAGLALEIAYFNATEPIALTAIAKKLVDIFRRYNKTESHTVVIFIGTVSSRRIAQKLGFLVTHYAVIYIR